MSVPCNLDSVFEGLISDNLFFFLLPFDKRRVNVNS
jgi:hypothetical protein